MHSHILTAEVFFEFSESENHVCEIVQTARGGQKLLNEGFCYLKDKQVSSRKTSLILLLCIQSYRQSFNFSLSSITANQRITRLMSAVSLV